ncbi:DUF4430 domain-containing protein [Acidilutibacter cellobiosedens]|jgi:biopolymer transport protein ExbD|uniref:DUF4430 domain-containing protein n=2 Tax=Acidilutibacter cellobiosedens TaxID=2507161 RepID=A0A410QE36_9FIRM|nr:DUF4430 domain-containing protein [Acidilutibacter cellobiosedens]
MKSEILFGQYCLRRKIMNKKLIAVLLILILTIPSFVFAQADFNIDYRLEGETTVISIQGERNKPVSISIKDNNRKYYINQGVTDSKGKIEFKAQLERGKQYNLLVNIDGKTASKTIVIDEKDPDDPDKPESAYIYVKGYDGIIVDEEKVDINKGETVLGLTKRVLNRKNIEYVERSGYIASIDGQGEMDKGPGSGWMYSVNGKFPNVGAGSVKVEDGDYIRWLYTMDLGKDLGYDMGDKPSEAVKPSPAVNNIKNAALKELANSLYSGNMTDPEIKKKSEEVISKVIKEIDVNKMNPQEIKDIVGDLNIIADLLVDKTQNVSYIQQVLVYIIDNLGKVKNGMAQEDSINSQKDLISTVQKALDKKSNIKVQSERITVEYTKDFETIGEFNRSLIKSVENAKITNGKKLEAVLAFYMNNDIEKIVMPTDTTEKLLRSGLDKLMLYFNGGNMKIPIKQLILDKEITIMMKNMADYTEIQILPEKKFEEPITIGLPYEKNGTGKTVMREDDNGSKENLGGIYDKENKEMVFTTKGNSKYYITDNPVKFTDLQNYDWARSSINSMASKGIINGRGGGSFVPSGELTRAEISALLVRMVKADSSDVKDIKAFEDVKSDAWYWEVINAAYENNLMEGKSETKFVPEGKITRQELTQAMANILTLSGYEYDGRDYLSNFSDNNEIAEWAEDGVNLSAQFGLIKGTDGKFSPQKYATRAETAVMLDRLYNLIINQ